MFRITVLIGICLFSLKFAYGLGVGQIEVFSNLNQPLYAEIPFTSVRPGEIDNVVVKLASEEAFVRNGLERPFYLTRLKFSVVNRDGKYFVKVTTDQLMREPFVTFLLDIDWPRGRLLREYTVLLDPPTFSDGDTLSADATSDTLVVQAPKKLSDESAAQQTTDDTEDLAQPIERSTVVKSADSSSAFVPEQNNIPEPAKSSSTATTAQSNPDTEPVQTKAYESDSSVKYSATPTVSDTETYTVTRGDSLWQIASQYRGSNVSVQQAMLALLQYNPDAFINNNINLLKQGAILRIPPESAWSELSETQAIVEVKQQNALWQEYRNQFAGSASSTAAVVAADKQLIAERKKPTTSEVKLNILAPDNTKQAGTNRSDTAMGFDNKAKQLQLSREELAAAELEQTELQEQQNMLQDQMDKTDRLLEVRNQQLADLQTELQQADDIIIEEKSEEETVEEETAEEATAETEAAVTDVAPKQQDKTYMVGIIALLSILLLGGGFAAYWWYRRKQAEEMTEYEFDMEESEVLASDISESEDYSATDKHFDIIQTEPKQSLLDKLMGLFSDRRKQDDVFMDYPDNDGDEVKTRFRTTQSKAATDDFDGSESVTVVKGIDDLSGDGEITKVRNLQQLELPESDDLTSEADVYLAYGLIEQAENVMQQALTDDPDNLLYKIKLLEIYFAAKNQVRFTDLVERVWPLLQDKSGRAVDKVVAMGKAAMPKSAFFRDIPEPALKPSDFIVQPDDDDAADTVMIEMVDEDTSDATISDDPMTALKQEIAEKSDFKLPKSDLVEEIKETTTAVAKATDDLGDKLAEVATDIAAELPQMAETPELDFEFDTLGTNDINGAEKIATSAVDERSLEFDLSDFELDIPEANSQSDQQKTPLNNLELKLDSDNSLNFELTLPTEADAKDDFVAEDSFAATATDTATISESIEQDEADIQLELAKAFIDIGDTSGAKARLQEIIAKGNSEQKRQAEELMQGLQ